jgi:hypothetical protein
MQLVVIATGYGPDSGGVSIRVPVGSGISSSVRHLDFLLGGGGGGGVKATGV